jgi:hypothetical protein
LGGPQNLPDEIKYHYFSSFLYLLSWAELVRRKPHKDRRHFVLESSAMAAAIDE